LQPRQSPEMVPKKGGEGREEGLPIFPRALAASGSLPLYLFFASRLRLAAVQLLVHTISEFPKTVVRPDYLSKHFVDSAGIHVLGVEVCQDTPIIPKIVWKHLQKRQVVVIRCCQGESRI